MGAIGLILQGTQLISVVSGVIGTVIQLVKTIHAGDSDADYTTIINVLHEDGVKLFQGQVDEIDAWMKQQGFEA